MRRCLRLGRDVSLMAPTVLQGVLAGFVLNFVLNIVRFPTTLTCPFGQVCRTSEKSYPPVVVREAMSIATEILSLRRDRLSSVTMLLALLDREHEPMSLYQQATRRYASLEAADVVLTNVAAHAAEAMMYLQPTTGRTRRATSLRGKSRRFNSGSSTLQRTLFASGRLAS